MILKQSKTYVQSHTHARILKHNSHTAKQLIE